ncbi:MAG: RNA polymerase factor sigma-32 [Candidatus Moranbacteria bacterium]|nr:RNA polymerase factor sigma-32 [Candidatus Moranbacteria bacterium]
MTQDLLDNHEELPFEELGISVIEEKEGVFFEEEPAQTEETKAAGAENDLLKRYIEEIRRIPRLTREEETALTYAAKIGDGEISKKARKRLITSNLRLVVKISRDFDRYWSRNLLDLIQEGNMGLMRSIQKFDPYRGIKLSYYASFWIKAYILKFIMDNWKLVKIGTTQAQRKLFYNLKREKDQLFSNGFEASPQLLADVMNVTEQEVIEMEQRMQSWDLSLETPIGYDSDESHKDFLPDNALLPEELVAQANLLAWLRENLSVFREKIGKREIFILDQRILSDSPLTLEEIGSRYNISRERVRQIEKNLLQKLKKFIKEIDPMKQGEGLTRIMGVTSAQVIRELGIETISQLISLTSDEFVQKLAGRKSHAVTVRAIANGMVSNNKFFGDGKEVEATKQLMNYHPSTYKPPAETPTSAPPPPAPPGEAGTSPPAAEQITAKTSAEAPTGEKSLRPTLLRFSAAFDFLTANGGNPEKIEGYEEGFFAQNGQEYLLSISIRRKNNPV